MSKSRAKPQGKSGPIRTGPNGVDWLVIPFPESKDERERLVADLFVKAFDRWVATESEPKLAPFGQPLQNEENDLDFTIETAVGQMRMELAEFAPLATFGPHFQNAPKSLQPSEKAVQALQLVRKKSVHQGGDRRFLVIYNTEHGFWLDPHTIERMRRTFENDAPRFERVYYMSIHDLENASVSEIFPGKPHHLLGDADLDASRVFIPHPTEFRVVRSVKWHGQVQIGGRLCQANYSLNYDGFGIVGEIFMSDANAVMVVGND